MEQRLGLKEQRMEPIFFGKSASVESSDQNLESQETFSPHFGKKTVSDILATSTDLLAQFQPTKQEEQSQYYQLIHKFRVIQVLYPENFEWNDLILNLYEELPPVGNEDISIVIHGHGRDKMCSTPTMCHIYGWQPTGAEHPNFLKRFKEKFPYESVSSSESSL